MQKILTNGDLKNVIGAHLRGFLREYAGLPTFAAHQSPRNYGPLLSHLGIPFQRDLVSYFIDNGVNVRRIDVTNALRDGIATIASEVRFYERIRTSEGGQPYRVTEETRYEQRAFKQKRFATLCSAAYQELALSDPFLLHLEPESGLETRTKTPEATREATQEYTMAVVDNSRRLLGSMTGIMDENPEYDADEQGRVMLRQPEHVRRAPDTIEAEAPGVSEGRVYSAVQRFDVPVHTAAVSLPDVLRDVSAIYDLLALEVGRRGGGVEDYHATIRAVQEKMQNSGTTIDEEHAVQLEQRALPTIHLAALQRAGQLHLSLENIASRVAQYLDTIGTRSFNAGIMSDILTDFRRGIGISEMGGQQLKSATHDVVEEWDTMFKDKHITVEDYRRKVRGLGVLYITMLPRKTILVNTLGSYQQEVEAALSHARPYSKSFGYGVDERVFTVTKEGSRLTELALAMRLTYSILDERLRTLGPSTDTPPGGTLVVRK